jgi:hypothetical protein
MVGVVIIMTRPWAGYLWSHGLIPDGGKKFVTSLKGSDIFWPPTVYAKFEAVTAVKSSRIGTVLLGE